MNQNKTTDFPVLGLDLQKYIEIIQKKSRVTRGDLKIDQNELHSEKNEKPKVIPKPKRKRNQPKIKEENKLKKEEEITINPEKITAVLTAKSENEMKYCEKKGKTLEFKSQIIEKNEVKIEENITKSEIIDEKPQKRRIRRKKCEMPAKNLIVEKKETEKKSLKLEKGINEEKDEEKKQEETDEKLQKPIKKIRKRQRKTTKKVKNKGQKLEEKEGNLQKINEKKAEETIELEKMDNEQTINKMIIEGKNEPRKTIQIKEEKIEEIKETQEKTEEKKLIIETKTKEENEELEENPLKNEENSLKKDENSLKKYENSLEKEEQYEMETPAKNLKVIFEKSSVFSSEKPLASSLIFNDFEIPIYSNFFENEDPEKIFSKALYLIAPNFLHGRLVKIIHQEEGNIENLMIKTSYIKKKQKSQKNVVSLSDNSCFNQEEDQALILQEPAFYPIDSEEKFRKIFDSNALEHFQEGFGNLAFQFDKINQVFNKNIIFWPVLIMQNYCKKNVVELVSQNTNKVKDDSYLNLEYSKKKSNLVESGYEIPILKKDSLINDVVAKIEMEIETEENKEKEKEKEKEKKNEKEEEFDLKIETKNEEPMDIEKNVDDPVLIYYFGTNYYEIVNVNDIKRMSLLDINHLKEFFYKNQFLKAIFSEYIRIIKEYNMTIEKNKNHCLSGKMKHYDLRIIKIGKKGESDKNTFFSILLHSKTLEDDKVYIFVKRLDNLQLDWICISNEEEKLHLTTDLNYPIINSESLIKLYIFEDSIRKRMTYSHNHKKIINLLLEFFYSSNQNPSHFNLSEKGNNFARIDEDLKEKIRCKICNYIIGDLDIVNCGECGNYFHFQCLPNHQNLPNKSSEIYKKWVCKECAYCQICYNKTKKDSMIACHKCEFLFHRTCVFVANVEEQSKITEDANTLWYCPRCLICDSCEKKFEIYAFEEGSLLCNQCKGFREKKEFCRVCNKPWIKPSVKMENKRLLKDWILCSLCSNWIHRFCDNSLRDDKIYSDLGKSNKDYSCPLCRNEQTNQKLKQFIKILSCLDMNKYFLKPVDAENVPYYKKVVNEPMDFETMVAKASSGKYLEDPKTLIKKDFDLICDNALLFNFPKSHIHIEAKKIKIIGAYAFEYFKALLNNEANIGLLNSMNEEEIKKMQSDFLESVDLYYFDILFSNENDHNKNIKILQKIKSPLRKNDCPQNLSKEKEILIEISGLNHLLESKESPFEQGSIVKSEPSNNITIKEKSEISSQNNYMDFEMEEIKSKNQTRNEYKMVIDPFLKLQSESILHTFDEMIVKPNNNKPFYYFEPILVAFNDYSLLNAENCFLCGAFSNNSELLTCYYCQENYHPYCLYSRNYNKMRFVQIKEEKRLWICPNCKVCEKCNKPPENGNNLFCHSCEKFYHLNCAYKNIGIMPGLTWKCENCFECSNCKTKEFFSEKIDPTNIQYEFCEDFKYCYECGILEAFKSFCKFCKKYISKSENPSDQFTLSYLSNYEDHLKCEKCNFKFHKNCYKEELKEALLFDEEFSTKFESKTTDFICQECEWSSEDKQKRALELQERLMIELTLLKKKNIVFKFNYDIIKIILDSFFKNSINFLNYETDSSNLIQEFMGEHSEFFETKEYSSFVNNLKIITKFNNFPHSKNKRKKPVNKCVFESNDFEILLEIKKIENLLTFNFFIEMENLFFDHNFLLNEDQIKLNNNPLSFLKIGIYDRAIICETLKLNKCDYLKQFHQYLSNKRKIDGSTEDLFSFENSSLENFALNETLKDFHEIKFGLILIKDDLKNIGINTIGLNEEDLSFFVGDDNVHKKKSDLLIDKNHWIFYNPFWVYTPHPIEKDNKNVNEKKKELDDLMLYENQMKAKIIAMFEKFLVERENKLKLKKELKQLNTSNDSINIEKILKASPKSKNAVANTLKILTSLEEDPLYNQTPKLDLIDGPLNNEKCILCKLNGERKTLGRLLNSDLNKWVHANCALWTQGVFENIEGGLLRFQTSFQKTIHFECDFCQKKNASILCSKFKTCKKKYHLNCAIEVKCVFLRDKTILCRNCLESGANFLLQDVLKDFQTERRLYIVDSQTNEKENTKRAKSQANSQEKSVPFYPGAFHRFGSLIVLNLNKSETNECNKGFDEYLIIRRVYDKENNTKKNILFLLYQSKRQYYINSKLMDSDDLTAIFEMKKPDLKTSEMEIEIKSEKKINIFELFQNNEINQFFIEFYQQASKIDDVFCLWEIISEKMFLPLISIAFDNVIDFISRFLGLNNTIIKRWIKLPIDSRQIFKRNCPGLSLFQNFFLKSLDDMNPFEKQAFIESIYNDIKAENYLPIEKKEKNVNCNLKNFILKNNNTKTLMVKEKRRRKSDTSALSDFNIKVDELINEQKIPLENLHIQPIKVQTEKELEKKLKQEYILYKKRALKGVYVAPSFIHKYGLFATNNFKKYEIIIEYVGEVVRNVIADKREVIYKDKGFGDCYMFRIDKDFVVDATFHGNQARYLNHSCEHNCASYILQIGEDKKIIMYANKEIGKGEEITYDYQFDLEAEKLKCTCGSKNCQGRLN